MSNNFWLTTTATRPTSVVPVLGGAFAYVCPQAADLGSPMRKRTAGIVAAHNGQGPQSWSPPLT